MTWLSCIKISNRLCQKHKDQLFNEVISSISKVRSQLLPTLNNTSEVSDRLFADEADILKLVFSRLSQNSPSSSRSIKSNINQSETVQSDNIQLRLAKQGLSEEINKIRENETHPKAHQLLQAAEDLQHRGTRFTSPFDEKNISKLNNSTLKVYPRFMDPEFWLLTESQRERAKLKQITFEDLDILSKLVCDNGMLLPREICKLPLHLYMQAEIALKEAQHLELLPKKKYPETYLQVPLWDPLLIMKYAPIKKTKTNQLLQKTLLRVHDI